MTPDKITALIVAITSLVGVVTTLIVTLRNKGAIQKVHLAVNSNLKATIARVEQLTQILSDKNITVPTSPPSEDEP